MIAGAQSATAAGEIDALLGLRIPPEVDFTRILAVARTGSTGETYACDAEGVLLSESRFDDELKQIGLLPDREDANSIFNVQVRNPGVDMTDGQRPELRRSEQPLTFAAAELAAGRSGSNVVGYRDYRGVPSVGAWTGFPIWVSASSPKWIWRRRPRRLQPCGGRFGRCSLLLLVASIVIFGYSILVARLERSARRSALEAKRLGQYVLEERIGSGGMGAVYRAHHDMLRRPHGGQTDRSRQDDRRGHLALRARGATDQPVEPSQHDRHLRLWPHAGRRVLLRHGTARRHDAANARREVMGRSPSGAVVNIMKQVCGSLIEAHAAGLIHRDIKPANIMINRRGGIYDFVKLLDFGLVKAVDGPRQSTVTVAPGLTGTPLYMSPEAIEKAWTVDARSDIYALGAVGYFLLTGKPVFEGDNIVEICMRHVETPPIPPSVRLRHPVSEDLESLLLKCLAKSPGDRPQSALELRGLLEHAKVSDSWTDEDAAAWWTSVMGIAQATTAAFPTQSGHGRDTTTIGVQ